MRGIESMTPMTDIKRSVMLHRLVE